MKKISLSVLAALFSIGSVCAIPLEGPVVGYMAGGFIGGDDAVVTVEQVKEMRDDSPVVLQGVILQRDGDEKYLFKDSTGTIVVEIDDEDWGGMMVTPEEVIKVYGDVDKGLFTTEIDVDYIRKM